MTLTELYFLIQYFFIYAFLGWCTEVAFAAWKEHRFVNRGFLNGPICPVYGFGVAAVIQFLTPVKENLILLYITSVLIVTFIEWLTGFILEKVFHNKWWDYSHMPFNIQGYVCLPFSLIWGVACVFIVDFFHPLINSLIQHIPFVLCIILLVLFTIAAFADLYVTASGILKLNKRLEKMQEIADELHQLSNKIGENIYKNTITAIERHEEISETLDDVSDEIRERIKYLHTQYRETREISSRIQKRLLKAFPKMQNSHHKEALEDLRKRLKELRNH